MLFRSSALPGSDGGLAARLQGVDNGIMMLVEAGSGRLDVSSQRPAGAVAPPLADDTALGWGKTLFVSSIIGSFGLLRLAGGLFLALAPLFAGFLLFEATRFLFFGWLRSLIAIAISSLGIAIVLGVELAIIEPWLTQVLSLRAARVATLSAPFELLALTLAFALAMFGMLALAVRISFATAAVTKLEAVIERTAQSLQSDFAVPQANPARNRGSSGDASRAQVVAQSVSQSKRRENGAIISSGSSALPNRGPMSSGPIARQENNFQTPLGRGYPAASRRVNSQSFKRNPAT